MADLFHRQLVTSDPQHSSFNLKNRIKRHEKKSLPKEVKDLLLISYKRTENEDDELETVDEDGMNLNKILDKEKIEIKRAEV
jgi:hypothetical protein